MNLNDVAREITLLEGRKKSLSIAQVKEVIRLVLRKLVGLSAAEVEKLLERHR